MANASEAITKKKEELRNIYPEINSINIPSKISNNVTLSTMHGCPPDEIEKIALYLIQDKKLHTTVKLNPTLLGPKALRDILNSKHNYETVVPDEAFGHDLKFDDALKIIKNLEKAAEKQGVCFSLKLTNTLESLNHRDIFPENEKTFYMSGRSLHPISVNVANALQKEFQGRLDISFAGGADCFNVVDLLRCGLRPVTVSSDVLKPGGYARFHQYIEAMSSCSEVKYYLSSLKPDEILKNLGEYAEEVKSNPRYSKTFQNEFEVKTNRKLPKFDCIDAPCTQTCPSNQDIPAYMRAVASGDLDKAYEIVLRTNPFPNVTGMVCDHLCQSKCTRSNYDQSLMIREIKRHIVENVTNEPKIQTKKDNGKKVAIIGGGPSGLAAAYFLRLQGFEVNLYEAKKISGGMVSDAIPSFRLSNESIQKDIERIKKFGVNIHQGQAIDTNRFEGLIANNDYIYLAIGAQKAKRLGIEGEDASGVIDQLTFLSKVRQGFTQKLGKKVAVIGGGNSAMDAIRTAKRLLPKDGKATLVYRRTQKEMPADPEEIIALLEEGCDVLELTAPIGINTKDGKVVSLLCQKMELTEKDDSGRRRPVPIKGSEFDLPVDTIIPAIGQDVTVGFLKDKELKINEETLETSMPNIFAGGDCVRGASSIIKAIADGRHASEAINKRVTQEEVARGINRDPDDRPLSEKQKTASTRLLSKGYQEIPLDKREGFDIVIKSLNKEEAKREASRCLSCDLTCDVCVSVCPNRANISYTGDLAVYEIPVVKQKGNNNEVVTEGIFSLSGTSQAANIGDFCNECGNCTSFCPSSGAPYKDKPKIYLSEDSFNEEEKGYFVTKEMIKSRQNSKLAILSCHSNSFVYETEEIKATFSSDKFSLQDYSLKTEDINEVNLKPAIEMHVLYKSLNNMGFVQ